MERPRETAVSVGTAAAVALCSGDPTRRLLILGVPAGGAMMIGTTTNIATGVSNKGLSVTATVPLMFTVKDHGILPTLQWFGIASGSPFTAYILEVLDEQTNYPETVSAIKRRQNRSGLILPGDNGRIIDALDASPGVNTDSLYDRLRRATGGLHRAYR